MNVPAMANTDDEYELLLVVDFVDDPIVARAYSPLSGATNQPSCGWRPGIGSEHLDRRLNPSAGWWIELAQPPNGGGCKGDSVNHVRPRSALTCSQGIGASPVAFISARASSAARISAMSSASSMRRSNSSGSITAAMRRPLRVR